MRDVIIIGILAAGLPIAFLRPWCGVLLWCWVAIGSPHQLAWSLSDQPVALVVGATTIAGLLLFPMGARGIPMRTPVVLMLALWAWSLLTTWLSLSPRGAWVMLEQNSKMLLFVFLTLMLFQDLRKLRWLLWVLVGSLGFYAVKGAIFSLATGGAHRIYGPPNTQFTDNNHLALALNMLIPLLLFLGRSETRGWMRLAWRGVAACAVLAVLFTYSRGGILGLAAVLLVISLRSKHRVGAIAAVVVVLIAVVAFAPPHLLERVGSIADYDSDASVTGRFNAWWFAWNVAMERPLIGGGLGAFNKVTFAKYAPVPDDYHVAHSIYFDMLGTQGFVGLGLFLSLLASALWRSGKLRRTLAARHATWFAGCAEALQTSFIAYMVCGAFLSMAWNDLFYHLVAVLVLVEVLAAPLLAAAPVPIEHPWREEPVACAA